MIFDWVLLVAAVVGGTFVFANARRLAERPRRGTAWRPSYRTYRLVAAAASLLIVIGALLDILSS